MMRKEIAYFEEKLQFYRALQRCFNKTVNSGFNNYIIELFQNNLNIQLDINIINQNKVIFKNNTNELIFSIMDIKTDKIFNDKENLNDEDVMLYIKKTMIVFLTDNICKLIS